MGPIQLHPAANLPWVLLMRNFHATLASAYRQAQYRIKVFHGSPSEFLRRPQFGVVKLVTFYNIWNELKTQLHRCCIFPEPLPMR